MVSLIREKGFPPPPPPSNKNIEYCFFLFAFTPRPSNLISQRLLAEKCLISQNNEKLTSHFYLNPPAISLSPSVNNFLFILLLQILENSIIKKENKTLLFSFIIFLSVFLRMFTLIYLLYICLFIYLSIYISISYLPEYLSIYLFLYLSIYLHICMSIYLSQDLLLEGHVGGDGVPDELRCWGPPSPSPPIYLFIYLSIYLSIYLFIYLYIYLFFI